MSLSETIAPANAAGTGVVSPQPAAPNPARTVLAALLGLGVVGVLGLLYAERFRDLYRVWLTNDNYSHGFLVPIVSLWIGWEVLKRQGLNNEGSTVAGLFWTLLGCALHLWSEVICWPLFDFLALATLLYGIAVLAGGRRWAQGFLFPILFLFFMFPLSPVLLNRAAQWLQAQVAAAGTWILQIFVPAYHTGNGIHIPGGSLEVGEACSGLRQMVAFFALSLLIAYYTRRGRLFRLAIVLAAAPVAVVANLMRVVLMAFLVMRFGSGSISESRILAFGISYHTAWGLLTMAVGLGVFLGLIAWMNRAFPARFIDSRHDKPVIRETMILKGSLLVHGGVAVLCLAAAIGGQVLLAAHLRPVEMTVATWNYVRKPLQGQADKGFPVSLGPWSGAEATPQPATVPTSPVADDYFRRADDKVNRSYVLKDADHPGPKCSLWMVHFRDGEDRQHHPLICYQVAGWLEDRQGRKIEPLGDGEPAQRFCFTRSDATRYASYVFYWHYTFEPPDAPEWTWLQRLHAHRLVHPSLTVQVFTDARTPEQLDQAAQFVRLVDQQLQAYLPPGARRGSDTLPITITRR
jgi:exosortase